MRLNAFSTAFPLSCVHGPRGLSHQLTKARQGIDLSSPQGEADGRSSRRDRPKRRTRWLFAPGFAEPVRATMGVAKDPKLRAMFRQHIKRPDQRYVVLA